ncbi:Cytochrome c-type biogenesis protein CcmF [Aliiroseovarius pelagivivens]|uniref:Cytochrome c-type biogenesis protein CcmF n=1 Tax=Aliiroseovarius pelagivivens TaxID=1639690 RepID=A0A2R8AIX6_9RHOB|nr:heme lyase CcmF/NrfE family subunit [Aliiroseovarius pelagivivens]SPF75824.1 Cytochrome c-type biogenesis protein CcmF [Aliiroseovarius pelagivivens]
MITELGHFALILALGVAVVQTIVPLIGAHKGWNSWMEMAVPAATIQFLLILASFMALTYAFVTSDFSVRLVTLNSHSAKPMLYKISGVWGNHEGSILLWVLIVAGFGATAAWFGQNLPRTLKARVLAVQSSIAVAFLCFIIFTSNPFLRLAQPPFDGQDLNPLLQDPGLAFHPPFLYLGYVGLSMAFSFAVAALIEGRIDAAWGRWVRPWTLAAWVFLTIGIGLGSWWAYYELGWGGFWFWDPVENASFMPWLFAAALLHSAIVVEKRESLKSWTILLAILAFGFSLIGTFIVRSGVITSVHAFASDPDRGVFILFILLFFTGGALTLFAARAGSMEAKGVFGFVSRESALVVNNILLAVSSFVVFVGTIWPLVGEAFDRKISVGPPFFEAAFTPFMVVLALVMPIGAMLPWKRAKIGRAVKQLVPAMVLSIAVLALVWAMQTGKSALGPIGMFLGTWLVAGSMTDIFSRTGRGAITGRLSRLTRLPGADWGKFAAHAGLGITMMGISGLMAWEVEDIRVAQIGETFQVAEYDITLVNVGREQGPNYISTKAELRVDRDGSQLTTLYPEKRVYPVQAMPTTEAAISNGFWTDIYLVIGDPQEGGGWAVRTFIKPFANWIWAGSIIMALGGMFSLFDRRFRVAAGAAKTRMEGVPAE